MENTQENRDKIGGEKMKYRIVKYDNHYRIEKKYFFMFWCFITEFECDILGYGDDYPIQFATVGEAEKYIDSLKPVKTEIIKCI